MDDFEGQFDSDRSITIYEPLDDFDPNDKLQFELHENISNDALASQGGLKAYETKKGGTTLYYADRPSDYSVSADRILWLDGYESTTASGERGREMTLIVLKIVLMCSDPDSHFRSFTADLSFDDKEKDGLNGPGVEAWGPFHSREGWNAAVAKREVTDKKEGGIKAGYQGIEASGTLSREEKVSWDQVHFDEGESRDLFGKTQRRNGVRWSVKQNELRNNGVTPQVWIGVLLSRTSRDPYSVRFSLRSRGGSWQEMKQGTKRFFGTKPDQTCPFLVTPWHREICNSEGEHIRQAIDRDNLGKLIGNFGTNLILPLGPDYHIVPPEVSSTSEVLAEAPMPALAQAVALAPTGTGATSILQGSSAAPPSDTSSRWYIPPDPVRLAAMEYRLAQAEARTTALETTILELRETLLNIKIKAQQT